MPSGDSINDPKVFEALRSTGFIPTEGAPRHVWDGTLADLNLFDAVLVLDPGFTDMPDDGETSLINYVNAGGALITAENLARDFTFGQFTLLETIFPVLATSNTFFGQTTYTRVGNDPKLNLGLPDSFSFAAQDGEFTAKAGATTFYSTSLGGGAIPARSRKLSGRSAAWMTSSRQ
jgi:hypothetical protein